MKNAKIVGFASFLLCALFCVSASQALAAATPWWGLTSESWPTNLHAGVAQDEVQELMVSATGGFVVLQLEGQFKFFKWDATHEEVQARLEEVYGPGNVEVSGGPVAGENCEAGCKPYVITFTGQRADRPVEPINATASTFFLSCEGATGPNCKHEATLTESAKGRADGRVVVAAENLGDAWVDTRIAPVVLEDTLPENLEAISVEAVNKNGPVECLTPTPHHVRCELAGTFVRGGGETEPKAVMPYEAIEMFIAVRMVGAAAGEANVVDVSGGGAKPATLSEPVHVGASSPFGVADYKMVAEEEGGGVSTQAGVHPFALTTTTVISTSEAAEKAAEQQPAALAKDLTFQLPAGLIGNPTPLPQCPDATFTAEEVVEGDGHNLCPNDTAVGEALLTYDNDNGLGNGGGLNQVTVPVFNLPPRPGEPARFGFEIEFVKIRVYLDTAIRSGGDYGVTVKVSNITQIAGFLASKVTFWGVPADPAHDVSRGWMCGSQEGAFTLDMATRRCPAGVSKPTPFLSLPTSCTGPMRTTVQADSWPEPHPVDPFSEPLFAEYEMGGLDGCNRLTFKPEIRMTPDVTEASSPMGLNVDVHIPQTSATNPESLAESNLKDIAVALPEGVAISPSGADGLQACSEGLAGVTGFSEPGHAPLFTATSPELLQPGVDFCPNASKVGEVTIKSPLLPAAQFLHGSIYLAAQNENPFKSLVALYLVAVDPISGVVFKSAGETRLTPSGQVIGVFDNNPQLAFEDAELHFYGGERAPLSSPAHCGAYTTDATFVPWSGTPPVDSTWTFNITSGPQLPGGGSAPCPGEALPFSPSLTAGTTSIQAGGFTPFTTTVSREDGQQNIQQFQLHLPPGLSGLLTGVELCGEAQANAGTCGPSSLIGETTVSVGLGGDPFSVTGGKVYITGPYEGASFGISVAVPAKAGPYDLGTVVVRGRIEVDPVTSALTVTTNSPSQGYAIPHILDGIPLEIKHVNFVTTRSAFTFNPTNCDPMRVTGTVQSVEGSSSPVSVPFQATNCAVLGFKPRFEVSTSGKTSRSKGASLDVKLAYPKAPFGSQANVRSVKVDLPKQLPSRLTTLQKACPDGVFNQNPAACQPASRVGTATATTPLVPVPLTGPVYFVSHGGAKFPELIIVLSGYGVTLDLHGETFINKAGITSSSFRTIPDAPVGAFELTLPQGTDSALAANGNLCKSTLKMPTAFVAQNGATIHQSTPIAVTGCKPTVGVVRHSVKGGRVTIVASVPAAGRLHASGPGLSRAAASAAGPGRVTVELALSKRVRALLAHHPGRSLRVRVTLRFTPHKGRSLSTAVTVLIG